MLQQSASHALSRTDNRPFDAAEQTLLGGVDQALATGRAIKQWWEPRAASANYAKRFELVCTFNRPDSALGFFDTVPLGNERLPVMGVVQDMLYDRPGPRGASEVRDQLREFVLHYFMRISAFREPEAYVANTRTARPNDSPLSWCPRDEVRYAGFGFSQQYYKLRGADRVGRFPPDEEFAIVDLREVGPIYDWLVVKVRIFDFNLTFRPFGPDAVSFQAPLRAENFLVVSPEYLTDRDDPAPGVLGEYGFGYTFIYQPAGDGLLAYGPGHFAAGFQLFTFRLLKSGAIRVRLVFVVNRPGRITNVRIAPVQWGVRLANLFSLGLTSRVFGPALGVLGRLPPLFGSFDPVSASITAANLLTAGWAAKELCISREQLEKDFLVHHFMQHYQMIVGSLLTWRQIPDWLDAAALPDFVRTGVNA